MHAHAERLEPRGQSPRRRRASAARRRRRRAPAVAYAVAMWAIAVDLPAPPAPTNAIDARVGAEVGHDGQAAGQSAVRTSFLSRAGRRTAGRGSTASPTRSAASAGGQAARRPGACSMRSGTRAVRRRSRRGAGTGGLGAAGIACTGGGIISGRRRDAARRPAAASSIAARFGCGPSRPAETGVGARPSAAESRGNGGPAAGSDLVGARARSGPARHATSASANGAACVDQRADARSATGPPRWRGRCGPRAASRRASALARVDLDEGRWKNPAIAARAGPRDGGGRWRRGRALRGSAAAAPRGVRPRKVLTSGRPLLPMSAGTPRN